MKDVKFDTVNFGGNILNQQGLFITKGPSITINGINSGGKQIINLADGVNANDAVNKGQLDKLKDEVSQEIAKIPSIENVVKYDQVEKDSITLGGEIGTNIKNVADGAIEEGSKDAINGNQLWGVQQQVNKNTGDIKNIQNNIENITNGKSGLVQQESPNAKITVGSGTGGKLVDISGTEGDRTIEGVKSGSINANSNQAVNGSQLHQTNQKVETNSNEINKLKDSDKTSVKYDSDMSNIVLAGNNGTAIKNVQNGNISSSSKDAINGSQLYQAKQDVLRDANAYTDNKFSEYDQKFNKYNKKANSGIAAALAMASIGQPTDIGYSMVSISTGTWEGESSIAIGTSGVTEDSDLFGIKGNYIWKFAGTSDSVGNVGGGASLNFQWK
ncbi:hypothetical protein AMD27_16185 (plasmid) [Acinetobacter sp. TGL-Y2]|uniref:YadA-like family protein n=1 Tax=Acinetobacter sp. TGL-Y2 TaxID=1407071 RepID=UPI0007A67D8C|nr:YadA C-terminal domain-containing protein [Acinetobacter sp. TGL-Y2]AMW80456.1 hypothetical protein AMD27_16185 [Acinetobacter sp. TGL-Y2]